MGSGTIIRIIVGIILLVSPFILSIYVDPKWMVSFFISALLIPLLFVMEDACNCSNCILSRECSKVNRFEFMKNFMKFLGYNLDKLKQIPYKNEFESSYRSIYKYIKNKYHELN